MLYIYDGAAGNKGEANNALYPETDTSGMKVLLINTRSHQSTIVEDSQHDQVDTRNFFVEMLSKNDDLQKPGVPPFDVAQMDRLQLSVDQTPEDWVLLGRLIQQNYHKYRGFVIQNGTDNMVSTATGLSFILENLGKPVIFTGSLIPGNKIYTDMKRNIILALGFASCGYICEVCILFDEFLYRANRTIKVSRSNLRPYDSPHFPPLASMQGGAMAIYRPLLSPHPTGKLQVRANMSAKVLTMQLGPSASFEYMMASMEHTTAQAVILRCYGSGNAPTRHQFMKRLLAKANEKNIVVVICTQNRYGAVDLAEYEAGRQLMEAGAISSGDMTHETTFVKLKYLFGLGLTAPEVRRRFLMSERGEVSMPSTKL